MEGISWSPHRAWHTVRAQPVGTSLVAVALISGQAGCSPCAPPGRPTSWNVAGISPTIPVSCLVWRWEALAGDRKRTGLGGGREGGCCIPLPKATAPEHMSHPQDRRD